MPIRMTKEIEAALGKAQREGRVAEPQGRTRAAAIATAGQGAGATSEAPKRKKPELVEADFSFKAGSCTFTIPLHVRAGDNFGSKDRHRRIGRAGHERTACTREFAKQHRWWGGMVDCLAGGGSVRVTLTRVGGGKMDRSNVVAAMKYVEDTVAAWLGLDDSDPRIIFEHGQEPTGPSGVRVTLEKA